MNQIKKIIAILLGVAVTITALFLVDYTVRKNAINQLQADVNGKLHGLAKHIEKTIDESLNALKIVATARANICSERQLLLMRKTVYEVDVIKEIGVSRGDGANICNHIGDNLRVRSVSETVQSKDKNVLLQVVEVRGSGKPALLVTWVVSPFEHYLAVIPTSTLLSQAAVMSGESGLKQIVKLNDDSPIVAHDWHQEIIGNKNWTSGEYSSNKYPIIVQAAIESSVFTARIFKIMGIIHSITIFLVIVLLGVAMRLWRMPAQPLSEIERAIKKDEFIPYYQPVIDISSGRVMGCEVLTRWQKSDGSLVPPGAFIALAEASGLAIAMTRSIMRHVADDLSNIKMHGNHLKIGINLFDAHFENTDIIDDIQNIFGDSDIDFSQLMFEVTERQPLSNVSRAQIIIKKIQSCGAKVALDDAGTGHGGLAYLQQFGMDAIKIDKMFIEKITAQTQSAPIVDSMINMANDLGMEIIAEGIETADQMEYLRLRGVKAVQGYLFAPPLPKRAYLELCQRLQPQNYSGKHDQKAAGAA